VALATRTTTFGPENASLQVKTYREGMAARAGHDLVMDVAHWQGSIAIAPDPERSTIELTADPRSLEVREGVGGVRPLTDKDRAEIRRTIDEKVLRGQPIEFRSRAVRSGDGDERLTVEGELTIAGRTQPVAAQFDVDAEGRVHGTIPLRQSDWGIKPYRGLMGALKVRDELEIVVDARLPPDRHEGDRG
jgi:polyisoprenoid-binding protein YceI